ncbi:MAG: fibronectin type III domain-containing protein [Chthonomonas sp.]|nr:fibronectin type III domain-containing protein [Chthonomonas sp.]
MPEWIYSNRLELQVQATKFSNGITSLGTGLGLTAGEVTAFGNALTLYNSDMTTWEDAQVAEKSAGQTFYKDKGDLTSLMRKYNKRMQASAGITNAKRAEIGLPIPGTSTTVTPKKVLELLATPVSDGTVKLKWNRSGNASSVIFIVERSSDGVEWEFAANSTSVKITLSDYAPGVQTFFRVVASRGALLATPSDPVVIYGGGEGVQLRVAA